HRLVPHEDDDAEPHGHRDQRRSDLPDAHAARTERDELVLPCEEPEADERADEHRGRHHLRQHERNLEEEEARDSVGRHVATKEAVESIEELGGDEDDHERPEREREGAQELAREMPRDDAEEDATRGRHWTGAAPSRPMILSRRSAAAFCSRSSWVTVCSRAACPKSHTPRTAKTAFGNQRPTIAGIASCSASA